MKLTSLTLLLPLLLMSAPSYSVETDNFRERIHVTATDASNIASDTMAEIEFGREVAAKILGTHKLLRDEKLTQYISLVGNRVARNANRPEISWHYAVIDTDSINAYTAPGGYVFVTKGALENMQDEAELAAVLAHEVAHVTERHIIKSLNIQSTNHSATESMARLVGSINESTRTAFNQVVDGAVKILFEKGLNHSDEYQADRDSAMLLAMSGYEPMALVRYLDKISNAQPASLSILSKTHPPLPGRLEALAVLFRDEKLDTLQGQTAKTRFTKNVAFITVPSEK